MKKMIVGAIVGGIIIFICQFLSWTILDLHRPANQYTPKQDEIIGFLNQQLSEDGSYYVPTHPPGATGEQMEQVMKESIGKPWAVVAYHKSLDMSMGMNIFRGLITDILMVALLCWILNRFTNPKFSNVFFTSLFIGFIAFLNFPYTYHIWFQTFDLEANLIDALVAWGLTGLWLGYLYGRTTRVVVNVNS